MESKESESARLVREIYADFEMRKEMKKGLEEVWKTNMDYLNGRQHLGTSKKYFWQKQDVYNHIAPMIEGRLAQLVSDNEHFVVVPLGERESDKSMAQKCEKILRASMEKHNMASKIDQANMWSEITGTAFYKVIWNASGGRMVGYPNIFEGDIEIVVCSPFEIFPDNLSAGDVDNLESLIHSKPMTTEAVERIWGVKVKPEDEDGRSVMVIERYKDGELIIVAGGTILFQGAMEGEIPFVRQTSESVPNCFFGKSVIERAIPIQRAINSVKNRKTEYLNRLSCGVVICEEGSVDVEALENDGLAPGSIIEYRAGTTPPKFMEGMSIPAELEREEMRLVDELTKITGGGNSVPSGYVNLSGVALDIIVAQDRLKIKRANKSGREARKKIAGLILRTFKKYATEKRVERIATGRVVELITWDRNDITSDDVKFEEGE